MRYVTRRAFFPRPSPPESDQCSPTTHTQDEEALEEIDPSAIVGRRTRGVKIDYTSKEALAKAGLQGNEEEDDTEDDRDVEMKD